MAKILEVVASLSVGGAERVALELAAGLNADPRYAIQAEMAVVGESDLSAHYGRSILDEARKRNVIVHEVRATSGTRWTQAFRQLVHGRGIDLVHVHNRPRDWQLARLCLLTGIPVVYSVHKPYLHRSWRTKLLYAALARVVTPVICVSRSVAEHVQKLEFAPARNCHVIYNGVNTNVFSPLEPEKRRQKRLSLDWAEDDFIWLCAARFHPQKAHTFLIDAVARLPETSRSRLVLAGEGPLEAALREQIARLRLESRVTFLGARSDVSELLGAADAYVMSSREEGHPLSVLEAMACQLPILAPRLPSITEIAITDAPTFFGPQIRGIAMTHDPGQIAEAMSAIESAPSAIRRAALASRQHVAERFSLEAMLGHHSALYAAVLAKPANATHRALRILGRWSGR